MTGVIQFWYCFCCGQLNLWTCWMTLSGWLSDSFTNYSGIRDGWEEWVNCLRATWNGFNMISPMSSNDSCNYCWNRIGLNGVITFLPINPWQGICLLITFPWLLMDMKVIVSQTSDPSVPHCIQFGSSRYICQRIVICIYIKHVSIQIFMKLISYGPF